MTLFVLDEFYLCVRNIYLLEKLTFAILEYWCRSLGVSIYTYIGFYDQAGQTMINEHFLA